MLLAAAVLVVVFLRSKKKTSVRILADSGASETFKVQTTPEQLGQLEDYYDLLRQLILVGEKAAPAQRCAEPKAPFPAWNREPEPTAREDEVSQRVTTCPNCQTQMRIKPEFLGRRAACRCCHRPFVVG